MADTRRSLSAILALLADNSAGNISAQDVRDWCLSTSLCHAGLYISSSAETTISASSTWYLAAGTSTETTANGFTVSTSNRVTYDGDPDVLAIAVASLSVSAASASKELSLGLGFNGSIHSSSPQLVMAGTDPLGVTIVDLITLSTADYLELFVSNETDTTNATIEKANLLVLGLFV